MAFALFLLLAVAGVQALRFDPDLVKYNLNQNQKATNPLDYSASRSGHTYHPSPDNWRFPFYSFFLDRFVNGDPSNDNANGTLFEQDLFSSQLRHGGDLQGMIDSLDYIQGMGIKGVYIAGSPFINAPWGADSYSPLDLTLLDAHFGDIGLWQKAVDEIHSRGMYVVLDHTMSTMGDLIGFDGFLNASTPFDPKEYKVLYKTDRHYHDFDFGNEYNETCSYPRFWNETGKRIDDDDANQFKGCFNSDFDQYGDTEAFGVHPDFQRQLTKFASVQDRLREWVPSVRERLEVFSCLEIILFDIDGFRFDKAAQVTVDAQGDFSAAMRECAAKVGKKNFFLPGELTSGNTFASIYLGRGRQPDQKPKELAQAMNFTDKTNSSFFIRDKGKNALDAAAFHYSVYRFLTRFLGLSGNLEAGFDLPLNWVDAWNEMVLTNDLVNANTGEFDPRHMYGVTNQDNFRWPAIELGLERELLGMFITTLHLPGIPLLYYGQEQGLYILDNTAENYIFGRQPMTPSTAWKLHGCYHMDSEQYKHWPVTQARNGCNDESVTLDHRDPSHPVRNIIKSMYHMRENYPSLESGWLLQKLANQTDFILFDGSNTTTELGIFGVVRAFFPTVQGQFATDPVWLVYHNRENETDYTFDCDDKETAFVAPFDEKTVVKNMFYPFDEITLGSSPLKLGFSGSSKPNGCIPKISMKPFEFRAYIPKSKFVSPPPMITKFLPGHDAPINSADAKGSVDVSFHFSQEMDCDGVTSSIAIASVLEGTGDGPEIDNSTVKCTTLSDDELPALIGAVGSKWSWSATLQNVVDGVHSITVNNATTKDGKAKTNAKDKFLIRVGAVDNPVVFPTSANYSTTLLTKEGKDLFVNHKAAGATSWRYSTNWGSSWSDWQAYSGGKQKISLLPWSGTKLQEWSGDHVMVQYFSQPLGSSSFLQSGDSKDQRERRFPHFFVMGDFNKFGFDAGIKNKMSLSKDGTWELHFMDEWPSSFQLNVWGVNPDGKPDSTYIMGDVDNDTIADRLPPNALAPNFFNATTSPPGHSLSYKLRFNDANLKFELIPSGNRWFQLLLFLLLATLPVVGGLFAVWIFMGSFYKVKINKVGFKRRGRSPFRKAANRLSSISFEDFRKPKESGDSMEMAVVGRPPKRRTVLIATMEYNIDDWNIKIKIGGLGVMAQLMGKALEHQDLIWVVPCVGGIDYPIDQRAEPMYVTIMGKEYEIEVQYHQVNNITYVLLDAPIFRKQSKADPYPPRMDDIESAIYYSAWNYCIAETIRRFPVDLYHINDYHGAAAPLYLLPERTIPCALSLHNAEFQGMWPMRTPEESKEVCEVFNLDPELVKEYVQFGSVFNLLHAGASYLRVHQRGFGAVGVSKKYGDRSYARYPIFWGLSKIGQLPNPDPTDTAEWDPKEELKEKDVTVDQEFEAKRGELRVKAQEWAGLEINPNAELFVFVGRWSLQKGVDLIADIFPSILEKCPTTQLICVGPVIDLYGKFAALKLSKLMEKYPKRVYSKPEFTALPPYIFSGAEFALIPSRDEPFGLVAVEFGRKGALGVGARVGGLGQMPGFWYTIESTAPSHLLHQFRGAIVSALDSKQKTRVKMRAWSARQRFPVAQWLEDLEKLQSEAIRIHNKESKKHKRISSGSLLAVPSGLHLDQNTRYFDDASDAEPSPTPSASHSRSASPRQSRASSLSVPFLLDNERSRSRSPSNPEPHDPSSDADLSGPLLPPSNLPFAATDLRTNRESSDSLATIVARGGQAGNRESVDTFAWRIMAPDGASRPPSTFGLNVPAGARGGGSSLYSNRNSSRLSVIDVVGDRTDYKLQKVDPFFTDSTGEYYKTFESRLAGLTAKNSDTDLCIEEFLTKSEKEWFARFRDAKLGRSRSPSRSPAPSLLRKKRHSRAVSVTSLTPSEEGSSDEVNVVREMERDDEFLLGTGYKPPKGLKKLLQIRLGDWPIYSFLLALGQILSANSYQIVLLTGEIGQTATKLYIVAGTYGATSILWWFLFRRFKSLYSLTLPWFFYGLAFILLGVSPFLPLAGRAPLQNVATAMYATGASTGSLFFALNFGDEGGAPISTWLFRACVIQGVQQVYVVALWYWGSIIGKQDPIATANGKFLAGGKVPEILVITVPIAIVLWAVGIVLFIGLPDYYRQMPDKIPSFYGSLLRRRIVPWFFLAVVIQNYWLSAPYGRSWEFLFSSKVVPGCAILLLAAGFLLGLWCILLYGFSFFSKTHPWIVPLFAIGLGAPRWAQMLWGTSGVGLYLPWVGGAVASAIVSRCLWLWLGLLDTVQGVGLGMVLLLTLTRQHVAATLIGAQVLGSIATIAARATAPDKIGPGDVFPDFSEGVTPGITKVWFWVALGMQLIIPIGFFKFFRKEQVAKP
ncbi:Cell wall alpha-1,3-glucan synthase mok13 [Pleurostoma richardsiae]|uniref:alpha-1,3-glucan synthase n=1 Tax=Pleurostoma richardsiae TaxID=41990 RepID=A0AA38R392_9PEZI|nr:Cell wall alpha-1,3-glucan synthase mok13 [Pleurostoma richardsiae]